MTRRILRGLAAATLLVALSAGAASAGGWATIQADTGNPSQPNVGEPFTFGFTVLQHGVTPAGWIETPTFWEINGATGERVEVKAVAQGGRWALRRDGDAARRGHRTWQVVLTDLIVETAPQRWTWRRPTASCRMDTARCCSAIERVRTETGTSTRRSSSPRPTRSEPDRPSQPECHFSRASARRREEGR